ncbi:unnamed protein product [Dibothriocephalus latus]|uniref:Uncharacterized protein n=1 Tax=Dibothriocephalus latus TaxID=60516 RepID=A0A3P7NPI4_DIBLA|nr:unnamed protein product [Dibothriocephalus latus]
MAESDLHFTLVGDVFLPLTEEEATAASGGQPTAVGWSHLFLTVLWNPDAVGVLSGWFWTEWLQKDKVTRPFAGCGDADCLNFWIGQRFTVCEDERQPGAVAHRSGQISLGNIAIFTGAILRRLKPDPHQSQDSHRIEQIRRLALSLALCGPEWCNTVASFDLGDRLLRANTVLRGLLQPHRLRSGDTTNQIHLSEAATKLLTPPSSDLPTVVPWFSLLKAIIKVVISPGNLLIVLVFGFALSVINSVIHIYLLHCLLAMVPSYSLDRVLWFSTCDFTVYEGDKPRLSTHSSAMLYANRPLSSVSNAS